MEDKPNQVVDYQQRLANLEQDESRLWRIALLFLSLLAAGLFASSWENLTHLSDRLQGIPIGMLVLGVLFALQVGARRRQIAGLRGVLHGMQEREKTPPSEEQLTRLLDAISNSQRNYRDLIDSLEPAIVGFSLQGVIQSTNRAFCELVNQPFAAVVGHNLDEFIVEPTRTAAEKGIATFCERRHWSGIVRVRVKNSSSPRFFDCVLHPVLKDDTVTGVSALARDITQERERESRFTELFETLQEGVYFSTPDGRLLDCNQALVRMLGYDTKEELLGVPVSAHYVDPADRAVRLKHLEDGTPVRDYELRLRRKDGQPIICLDTSRAIFDDMGRGVRYQGALIDITARRAMESRLHEQEEFRRRLVDSFPDLILVFDSEGRYTFVSPRVREVLGYEPEMFLGKRIQDDGAPGVSEELLRMFKELMAGPETSLDTEYSAAHLNGNRRTLRASASHFLDAQGKPAGVVASVRDVTTLKEMEQQLIQSERLAAMGQMIDGFAHELNNPLTAILGAVELLETTVADQASGRRLELLKQQARRAAEVVQNLLFFARPPAAGKSPLNLNNMVQKSLQLHEHSLKLNNITVDLISEATLPSVVGDPHQIMQVFLNLIINAEQAIREVRPKGTLRVRMGRRGESVWASFQDDGPGISPETLPRIFDPFFTTKRPGRGTGLGLSVALAILRKYDGTIDAQNAPGGGAVFTVTLPAVPPKPVPPAGASSISTTAKQA